MPLESTDCETYVNSAEGIDSRTGKQMARETPRKVAIVTGANSGIGFEVAKALLEDGVHVVLACRDGVRATQAIETLRDEVEEASAEIQLLNLASLQSVERFAVTFRTRFKRLDLLVNNAGVMFESYGQTEDGFELHWGINHLGHFALTGHLIDRLLATPRSRVVTVTSAAYRFGRLSAEMLPEQTARAASRFQLYARSKRANLLFAVELERRLKDRDMRSIAAHPGGAATGLGRHASESALYRRVLPFLERLSQSAAQGARPIIEAATSPKIGGGELCRPGGWLEMRGSSICRRPRLRETDARTARKLWRVSEQQTGLLYPFRATVNVDDRT